VCWSGSSDAPYLKVLAEHENEVADVSQGRGDVLVVARGVGHVGGELQAPDGIVLVRESADGVDALQLAQQLHLARLEQELLLQQPL
jgi:hypothetical protein